MNIHTDDLQTNAISLEAHWIWSAENPREIKTRPQMATIWFYSHETRFYDEKIQKHCAHS